GREHVGVSGAHVLAGSAGVNCHGDPPSARDKRVPAWATATATAIGCQSAPGRTGRVKDALAGN
ncbi:hypothetical protein PNP85_15580, partial [Halobacterium salinarum]|uniref:hypothetical protein n=1 Tax=Halobacterium salinarum TaxID=2242 RepID=UPI0025521D41